jgi:hypothetical protein
MADLDGVPRTAIRTPREVFQRMRATGTDILTWQGELVQQRTTSRPYHSTC